MAQALSTGTGATIALRLATPCEVRRKAFRHAPEALQMNAWMPSLNLPEDFIQLFIGESAFRKRRQFVDDHFVQECHDRHTRLPFLGGLFWRKIVAH
jgi:hypothetical protein